MWVIEYLTYFKLCHVERSLYFYITTFILGYWASWKKNKTKGINVEVKQWVLHSYCFIPLSTSFSLPNCFTRHNLFKFPVKILQGQHPNRFCYEVHTYGMENSNYNKIQVFIPFIYFKQYSASYWTIVILFTGPLICVFLFHQATQAFFW